MDYLQWSDVGMLAHNLLLLVKENNLDTCAKVSWASFHNLVNKHTKVAYDLILICRIVIGYVNLAREIKNLKSFT